MPNFAYPKNTLLFSFTVQVGFSHEQDVSEDWYNFFMGRQVLHMIALYIAGSFERLLCLKP